MRRDRRAKTKKTSNRAVSVVICVLVVAICVLCYSKGNELKTQNEEENRKIEELQKEIEQEQERTQELDEYSKYVNTKQFVEDMAREKLGLIYPGEIIFKSE